MPKLRKANTPRLYSAGGVQYPSVTEILKVTDGIWMNQLLAQKGRKEADRILNEAATLGTKVHKLASDIALEQPISPSPEFNGFAGAISEFLHTRVKRVIYTELSLTNTDRGYGGTLDLYAEMLDGSYAVIDYKTNSGGLTRIHGLQLAGYALLVRDRGLTINKRIAVRLHKAPEKRGKWYARDYPEHRKDTEAFLAAKTLWYFLHSNRLKGAA